MHPKKTVSSGKTKQKTLHPSGFQVSLALLSAWLAARLFTAAENACQPGDHPGGHPCPMCGSGVSPSLARYPRAVCAACAQQAADEQGRLLVFFNENLSGGLLAIYRDSGETVNGQTCFIHGVRCRVQEARMGGVVIEPLESHRELGSGH